MLLAPRESTRERPAKLLDLVSRALRLRHYSPLTERAYCHWIVRYISFTASDIQARSVAARCRRSSSTSPSSATLPLPRRVRRWPRCCFSTAKYSRSPSRDTCSYRGRGDRSGFRWCCLRARSRLLAELRGTPSLDSLIDVRLRAQNPGVRPSSSQERGLRAPRAPDSCLQGRPFPARSAPGAPHDRAPAQLSICSPEYQTCLTR
jgi:hypothetical protein